MAIVRGALPPPQFLQVFTQENRAALSETERSALRGEPVPVNAVALAKLAVVRWRLAAGVSSRPATTQDIDRAAVEGMLVEADEALAVLRALEETCEDESIRLLLDQAKGALAAHAVELASMLQETTKTDALGAVQSQKKKYEAMTKKAQAQPQSPTAFFPREEASRAKGKGVWILFALAATAAATFHGYRHFSTEAPVAAQGPVEGSVMLPKTANGITVFHAASPGAISPAELERLSERMSSHGKEVLKVGPGEYAILPTEAAKAIKQAERTPR